MLIKLNTAWRRVGQQACFVSWMQHCRTRGGGGAAAGACAGVRGVQGHSTVGGQVEAALERGADAVLRIDVQVR